MNLIVDSIHIFHEKHCTCQFLEIAKAKVCLYGCVREVGGGGVSLALVNNTVLCRRSTDYVPNLHKIHSA